MPHKVIIWSPAKRRSWRIAVEKVDNHLAFTNGWTVFVQENSLKFADFLLFRYVGNSKFSVRMYGKDGCEKKLDPPVSRKEKAKQDARAGKDRSLEETRKNSVLSCDEGGRDGNSVPVEANEIGMSNSPRKFRGNEFSLQNTTRETEPSKSLSCHSYSILVTLTWKIRTVSFCRECYNKEKGKTFKGFDGISSE